MGKEVCSPSPCAFKWGRVLPPVCICERDVDSSSPCAYKLGKVLPQCVLVGGMLIPLLVHTCMVRSWPSLLVGTSGEGCLFPLPVHTSVEGCLVPPSCGERWDIIKPYKFIKWENTNNRHITIWSIHPVWYCNFMLSHSSTPKYWYVCKAGWLSLSNCVLGLIIRPGCGPLATCLLPHIMWRTTLLSPSQT